MTEYTITSWWQVSLVSPSISQTWTHQEMKAKVIYFHTDKFFRNSELKFSDQFIVRHSPYTKGNSRFTHVLYKYFLGNPLLLSDLVVIFKNTYIQRVSTEKIRRKLIFLYVFSNFYLKNTPFSPQKKVSYTKLLFLGDF